MKAAIGRTQRTGASNHTRTSTEIPLWQKAVDDVVSASRGDLDEAEARLVLLSNIRRRDRRACYFEPAGDQLKFWEQLRPEQKIWVVLGGNQSGKSILACWMATVWMLGKEYFRGEPTWKWVEPLPVPAAPSSVRFVGLDEKLLRDPIWSTLMESVAEGPMFPADSVKTSSAHQMIASFNNGSSFHVRSAAPTVDPATHGGVKCDLVCIDEECGKGYYQENYQRTITKGGKLLVTATPLTDIGTATYPWLFDLVEEWRNGNPEIGVIFMSTLSNPYIPEEEKRRLKTRWEGDPEEQARLHGEFVRRGGLFYDLWRPEPPLWVPASPISPSSYRVCMIDPASTGPVAALWAAFDSKGKMSLYRCYKQKNLTTSQHVENILTENRGDAINLWLIDPFMGRQKLAWHSEHGDHRTVMQLWRDSGLPRIRLADVDYDLCLEESREYMKAAFDRTDPHPAVEIFDHLTEIKEELDRYVRDAVAQGPRRGEVRDRPRKGNDDLINAWQYICGMRLRARSGSPIRSTGNYFS